MNFSERLAAAKTARPFKDQPVVLDQDVSDEVERLEAEIASAANDNRLGVQSKAEKAQKRLDEIRGAGLETIRVYRLPGRDWANLTSKCPIRPGVAVDQHYGYNYDAVCEAALRYRTPGTNEAHAFVLEDGKPVEITDDQWDSLLSVLSGNEYAKLRDRVWELNEYEPELRLQELVKGSGAASRSVNK